MRVIKYNNREIILLPYTTSVERDLIINEPKNLDDALIYLDKFISVNINGPKEYKDYINILTEDEKINIILELRNISISEIFNFVVPCKCKKKSEKEIKFDDCLVIGDIKYYEPRPDIKLKNIVSENIYDFTDYDLDELEIDEFDGIEKYINDNRTRFNFSTKCNCDHCGAEINIELNTKTLLEGLSEDTAITFYKGISSLVYLGKYTKLDIDSMLPFERNVYLGLLNEQIKNNPDL